MPSFDIVSNTDQHEITNAIDQANREVSTSFDFKGTNARFELNTDQIILIAPSDFQLKQMDEILCNKLAKRGIDIRSLNYQTPIINLNEARLTLDIKQGIEAEHAKKIIKLMKESGLKVQATMQENQIRVTGKKRDDLQNIIAVLKEAKIAIPLQFVNFRD